MMSHMDGPQQEAQGNTYRGYEGAPNYQQPGGQEPSSQPPPYQDMYDDTFIDAFAQRFAQRMYQGPQGKLQMPMPWGKRLSPGQRLALAIVSVAMLVPLAGISLGTMAYTGFWGLVALFICGMVILFVNVIFNLSH